MNKIKFIATSKHVMEVREKPVPASSLIPDWWKSMPIYSSKDNKLHLDPYPTITAKKCFPMIDAITSGYIMPLWSDIMVSQNDKEDSLARIQWLTDEPVAEAWSKEQSSTYDFPEGYSKIVFKYSHGWLIKTPPGWSSLIVHPIGYNNLPIKTITGIVDTDKSNILANSPFLIKSGFEGIIKKGTPMFQIIPFKRNDWQAEYEIQDEEISKINLEKYKTKIVSYYGEKFRQSKKYT